VELQPLSPSLLFENADRRSPVLRSLSG
jgi:hypothetical protein